MTRWHRSDRFDPRALPLANKHYNRRKIGSPQFVPPGRCLVFLTADADALWVSSWPFAQYVRHAWGGAWVCSLFRNESHHLSSELIREAVAATRDAWGEPPPLGMVSFIDPKKTRKKRDPGRCYLRAGWSYAACPSCGGTGVDLAVLEVAVALAAPFARVCAACLGTRRARTRKEGLVVVQQLPEAMPPPSAAIGTSARLFAGAL